MCGMRIVAKSYQGKWFHNVFTNWIILIQVIFLGPIFCIVVRGEQPVAEAEVLLVCCKNGWGRLAEADIKKSEVNMWSSKCCTLYWSKLEIRTSSTVSDGSEQMMPEHRVVTSCMCPIVLNHLLLKQTGPIHDVTYVTRVCSWEWVHKCDRAFKRKQQTLNMYVLFTMCRVAHSWWMQVQTECSCTVRC